MKVVDINEGESMYIGRIVCVSRTKDDRLCASYRVSSRSFPNRTAVIGENKVSIVPKAGHEADVHKNPYIAYNCVRVICDGAVAVVTNVEADHLDTYGSLEGVFEAFEKFLDGLLPDGSAVICADDHGASRLVTRSESRVRTYGLGAGAQVRAVDVEARAGGMGFRVIDEGVDRGTFELQVPGVHNLLNALGAASAARCFGVDWGDVRDGLTAYQGVERRFQTVGLGRGILIVDDYAHHPSEIRATLAAARGAHPDRRIVAVFQPHLFTRTRDFADEFGRALTAADSIWVTDVFPAREDPIEGVTGEMVALAAGRAGGDVHYHADVSTMADAVMKELVSGDLLLTMGAGSIDRVAHELVARLEETPHA